MGLIILHDRAYDRREDVSATATPATVAVSATPSVAVVQPLPTSVKALTGFLVVFGLIILGIAAWKIGKWRRNKIRAASQSIGDYKPKSASVVHVDLVATTKAAEKLEVVEEPYKWQPIARPEPARSNNKVVKKETSRFLSFIRPAKSALSVVEHSPPPAYCSQPQSDHPVITIDGSRASEASPHLVIQMLQTDPHPPTPLPSPVRTKSIGPDTPLYKSLASASTLAPPSTATKNSPRLMVVVSTFVPSLGDELAVQIGEPLMMLEEYEDEWCMVKRLGREDAERGVVPRFCLQNYPAKPQFLRDRPAKEAH